MIDRKTERWFALAVVISVFVLGAGLSVASPDTEEEVDDETQLHIMQIQNNSLQTGGMTDTEMIIRRNDLVENLNYTSTMLQRYMSKNISDEEAFFLTTSILAVNTQSISALESMEPREEHQKFYTYTLEGLRSLNLYLWDMAKFFQSGERVYMEKATVDFADTLEYYELSKEEAEFLF